MRSDAPRILIIADKMAAGGMERQIVALLAGLQQNARFRAAFARLDHGGEWDGEAARHSETVLPLRRKARYDITPALALIREARAARVDLIHAFGWMSGLAGLVAARCLRIPAINGSIRATPPRLRPRDRISRWCALRSDVIVANSSAGFAAFGLLGHPRTRVIHNGIDLRRFEGVAPERLGERAICMVANFSRLKDHITPIRAMVRIRAACAEATLVLIGNNGGTQSESRQLVDTLRLTNAVRFVSGVTRPEPLIAGSEVCVLTSPEGEGLSNSILEYMALGKPVVATDCGGNREVIRHGETGFLVPGHSPEQTADRVIELLRDPERGRRMGEQGRREVHEKFSMSRMVVEYEALYSQLLGCRT